MTTDDEDDFAITGFYQCHVLVLHPIEPADGISRRLRLTPTPQDGLRTLPNGEYLPDGTVWSAGETVGGNRFFFRTLVEGLARLDEVEDELRDLIASGGRVMLILNLPGSINIGDSCKPQHLLRMGQLGIDLGIEVFPESTAP